MDDQGQNYMKGAVEALLFISDKPITVDQMREALETLEPSEIKALVAAIEKEYAETDRGMRIVEIAGGFQMLSSPQYAEYIRNLFKTRVKEKLSRPALEALAISAYRQPVSRSDIEMIRGVNSDGVVTHLLEKGLIKIVGRKDVPGRPFLYGTTKAFLEYFGLKELKDLPKLEDFAATIDQHGAPGGEGSGDLFFSNAGESVETSVAGLGDDHVNQSFAREAVYLDDPDAERAALPDSGDGRDAAEGLETDDRPEEAVTDLKKVMDELNRGEGGDGEATAGLTEAPEPSVHAAPLEGSAER